MTTAFQTGPGFYAADSVDCDKTLPKGVMRIYCARLEAYDMAVSGDDPGHNTTFEILAAKGENDSRVAKALLKLGEFVNSNEAILKEFAAR